MYCSLICFDLSPCGCMALKHKKIVCLCYGLGILLLLLEIKFGCFHQENLYLFWVKKAFLMLTF